MPSSYGDPLRALLKNRTIFWGRSSSEKRTRGIFYLPLGGLPETGPGRCRTSALAGVCVYFRALGFTRRNSHSYSRYAREIFSVRLSHRLPFRAYDSRSWQLDRDPELMTYRTLRLRAAITADSRTRELARRLPIRLANDERVVGARTTMQPFGFGDDGRGRSRRSE